MSDRLPQSSPEKGRLCIFSGGTAFNAVTPFLVRQTPKVSYILPVSDDGGSTAEIIRVLGGPAIGDIRSRLLRLAQPKDASAMASLRLLKHRLPRDHDAAIVQWRHIIDGVDTLWTDISPDHEGASVGNLFFTGARLFFNSLQGAITMWKMISSIDPETEVIPVVDNTDAPLVIAALLNDVAGTLIVGQNNISHPPPSNASSGSGQADEQKHADVAVTNAVVEKDGSGQHAFPNGATIAEMRYVDLDGKTYQPPLNPTAGDALAKANAVVYAMGSLFTSIIPTLIVRGVGDLIANKQCPKILLLNGTYDRESIGMTATGFIYAVTKALNQSSSTTRLPQDYINQMLIPYGCQIDVNQAEIFAMGITIDTVAARSTPFTLLAWERGPDGEPWERPHINNRAGECTANDDLVRSYRSSPTWRDKSEAANTDAVYFDEHALAACLATTALAGTSSLQPPPVQAVSRHRRTNSQGRGIGGFFGDRDF